MRFGDSDGLYLRVAAGNTKSRLFRHGAIVAALAAEHAPQGPTQEHLVEELAGVVWRKRRLRLAEAAVLRQGLNGPLYRNSNTATMALVHFLSGVDSLGRTQERRAVAAAARCRRRN